MVETQRSITAKAHPNIAFIKYWGNQNNTLRIPSNGSISMNLASLSTVTTISISNKSDQDSLEINGTQQTGPSLIRVQQYLGHIRKIYSKQTFLSVQSSNDFPMAAGIASSASAFAALAMAAVEFFNLDISEKEISALARLGSGSACRSIPSGFTEWKPGARHEDSYAISIAKHDHWDLWDCIAVVQNEPKDITSTHGHRLANTSPLQNARLKDAARRLEICRNALKNRDFETFAEIIEIDSNMMHAIMMTSNPSIMYWQPTSLKIIHEIRSLRKKGTAAAFTLDAGANVHVICEGDAIQKTETLLRDISGVKNIIKSSVGSGAEIVDPT
jgi:diphosphomevalonate decarboxylase